MRQTRAWVLWMLFVTVIFCAVPAHALTLAGQLTPDPASVLASPCPTHAGYDCVAAAYDAQPLNAGPNASFETAWNAKLDREWDPTGWTLNWATEPLNATLNISTYRAYNDTTGPTGGGAEIRIDWTPAAGQQDLKWIQALHTNRSRHPGTDWCLDVYTFTATKPPLYPYQYPTYYFYDAPGRSCEAGQRIFWDAYTYLCRIDRATSTATIYEGVYWGWTLDCYAVPEPSGLLILACGLCFGARFSRRRTGFCGVGAPFSRRRRRQR